jgi:hypothetical protein
LSADGEWETEEEEEEKGAFHGWAIVRDNVGEVNVMDGFGRLVPGVGKAGMLKTQGCGTRVKNEWQVSNA